MNVTELNGKYQRILNWDTEYRKELVSYINEAIAMHGNEFEYKCDTHESWKDKDKDGDFNAMDDLPAYLSIWVNDDGGHEIYPYRIRNIKTDYGFDNLEMDGYDWNDSEWVERVDILGGIDNLISIAEFINAVLEQENKG